METSFLYMVKRDDFYQGCAKFQKKILKCAKFLRMRNAKFEISHSHSHANIWYFAKIIQNSAKCYEIMYNYTQSYTIIHNYTHCYEILGIDAKFCISHSNAKFKKLKFRISHLHAEVICNLSYLWIREKKFFFRTSLIFILT